MKMTDNRSDRLWRHLRDAVIDHLKGKAVKLALKKFLGSALAGGFKAWLVKFIVTELFEELAEPIVRLLIRKGFLVYDKTQGAIRIKKLRQAKEEGDEDEYNQQVDDL